MKILPSLLLRWKPSARHFMDVISKYNFPARQVLLLPFFLR